jgi:hypothetical protein
MAKYELSQGGILQYCNDAIGKVKKYNQNLASIDANTPVINIWDEVEGKEYHVEKEYHAVLKTLNDDNTKYEFWRNRLINVRDALNYCIEQLKPEKCNNIELGIFGSESASSDIDIGVSYKKGSSKDVNMLKLSQVVECFEYYFVEKKYTSLDIDVEMYADYFISPRYGLPFIQTNKYIYIACLPFVLAGIMKNIIQAMHDKKDLPCDTRRIIDNVKATCDPNAVADSIDQMKVIDNINSVLNTLELSNNSTIKDIIKNIDSPTIKEAKGYIKEYMKSDYEQSRTKYYRLLNAAHEEYIKPEPNMEELSKKISHALVYRAESYLSAPTIYHVVYTMQAKPQDEATKKNLNGLITSYGYKISILEQLGFLTRFYNQYKKADNPKWHNNPNWKKKNEKYMGRLNDALEKIGNKNTLISGGKRVTQKRMRKNKGRKIKSNKKKSNKKKSNKKKRKSYFK